MKIIVSSFLLCVFIGTPSLRAQDAPTRLGKDPTTDLTIEPTPLPKITATPQPRPKPTPTPPPSPPVMPTPIESPALSPTPTASPVQKEEEAISPKREATPRRSKRTHRAETTPTPQPENPPTPSAAKSLSWLETRAIASKLKSLEKEWEASFSDPAVIEKSLAEDFVGTSPAGEVLTKKDLLREAQKNPGSTPKTEAHDLDVYLHGPDLAIVTGAARQFNRNRAGQLVQHNYRFTDTWVQRDGKWQCIASQSMLVPRE